MNWDEGIDFADRKSAELSAETHDISVDPIDIHKFNAPNRVRKAGLWGDDGIKSARKSSTNLIEQERFHDNKREENDDDIPIIPDIEDIQDDVVQESLKKPMMSVKKSTYKELDSYMSLLQKEIVVGNVNLTFLATHLYQEEDVKSTDELWSIDDLFDTMLLSYKN